MRTRRLHRFNFSFARPELKPLFSAIFHHLSISNLIDFILSVYFYNCSLSPCRIELDDQTTVHYWTPRTRHFNKPNLVVIHGCGGNPKWQFVRQVGRLSEAFNLFLPDLLFFGKSHTERSERSDYFQAKCVGDGLRRLGVGRFSVYGISYGGFVAARVAEMWRDEVEKVVIVSCGIVFSEEQREKRLREIGRSMVELFVPEKASDLRPLISLCFSKLHPLMWVVPDFVLRDFFMALGTEYKKERRELLEHLLARKAGSDLPLLTQETLLIWGEEDAVFPLFMAYQLQRYLGPKASLEVLKGTGHAANLESPREVNELIESFVLGH
ncbi:hypothetical protein Nepgr_016059 [Nepenthes gracilis]|uniref:AB hydrolase-1 domain-containing protein n=1 Tax=Nepenthes gracilis TaxID=150966 RepID=A0AAD3XR97_NEPGR|nr:hypothetical protein Nepgr_016059 [Nepenthes gracilis]